MEARDRGSRVDSGRIAFLRNPCAYADGCCDKLRLGMPIVTLTSLFAVVTDSGNFVLAQAIANLFPENHIAFGPGRWFVVTTGTSKDLSDKLGSATGPAAQPWSLRYQDTTEGPARTFGNGLQQSREADKC